MAWLMCVTVSALHRVCWKDPNLVIITCYLSGVFALISTKSSGSILKPLGLTRVPTNVEHSSISRSSLLGIFKFNPEMEWESIVLTVLFVCLLWFEMVRFGSLVPESQNGDQLQAHRNPDKWFKEKPVNPRHRVSNTDLARATWKPSL